MAGNPSLWGMTFRPLMGGLVASVWLACQAPSAPTTMTLDRLHPSLAQTVESMADDTVDIAQARQSELNDVALWVANMLADSGHVDLTFICTHNSRRSHLAQVWAQVGAEVSGLQGVRTFSGGTEATACNPRTVAAMRRAGFQVAVQDTVHGATNPTYDVSMGKDVPGMACFSKTYTDEANPQQGFGAVMTCSSADRECPLVHGAAARFATPYVDPKVSDGTDEEAATYDARCRQIGTEMLYLMGEVKRRIGSKGTKG